MSESNKREISFTETGNGMLNNVPLFRAIEAYRELIRASVCNLLSFATKLEMMQASLDKNKDKVIIDADIKESEKIIKKISDYIYWLICEFNKKPCDQFLKRAIQQPLDIFYFYQVGELMQAGCYTEDIPVLILECYFKAEKERFSAANLAELTHSKHLEEIALPAWKMLQQHKDRKNYNFAKATNSPHLKEIALPAFQLIEEKKELCFSSVFVAMACSQHLEDIALPAWEEFKQKDDGQAYFLDDLTNIMKEAKTEKIRTEARELFESLRLK